MKAHMMTCAACMDIPVDAAVKHDELEWSFSRQESVSFNDWPTGDSARSFYGVGFRTMDVLDAVTFRTFPQIK